MNPSLSGFLEAWDVFRDAVLASLFAGATLGCLGVYIVLRRMVFVSAALSQAAGVGVALAFYVEIVLGWAGLAANPLVWASTITLLITAVLLRFDGGRWLSRESLLGWVYLAGSAGALVLGTRIQQEAHEISSILFGTAVLVNPTDLHAMAGVCGVALLIQVVLGRGLRLASFDRDGARVRGLPVQALDAILFATIALVVSLSTRVLGALPVFAFSVLPAMAAILVAHNVQAALLIATALGGIAGAVGYYLAYMAAWPVGASEAGLAAALVLVAAAGRGVARALRTTGLLKPASAAACRPGQ